MHKQAGKLCVKRMCRVMIDSEEHTPTLRSGIRNLQAFKFLSKSLRCESAAEYQTGEQYSKQDKIKELKHFIKTDASPKILEDFLNKPSFCAIIEETERRCDSKVNLLSKVTPRILKESLVVKGTLSIKRSGC